MNKRVLLCAVLVFSCQAAIDINDLPWIDATDDDAIKYAAPFLPENPVILEAGVCDALDTLSMKARWPNAVIYGFEALPKHYELSYDKLKDIAGVMLQPCALFDRVGELTFYFSAKIPGASSLLQDNLDNIEIPQGIDHDGINYRDTAITVKCTTIDQWVQDSGVQKIDYLWLDTEGAELYILRNAKSILPAVKVISIEINFQEFRKGMTQFQDLYAFLTNEGFKLQYIWGNRVWQGVGIFVNTRHV